MSVESKDDPKEVKSTFLPLSQPMSAFEMNDLEHMIQDPYFIYDSNEQYLPHPQPPPIDANKIRELFQSYFFKHSITRQQTESFDFFMEILLPSIIKENKRVEVISKKQQTKHVIEFGNVVMCKPMFKENDGTVHDIDPVECMARKATYSSSILVDVTHSMYERKPRAKSVVPLPSASPPVEPILPSKLHHTNILQSQLSRDEEEMRNEEVKMEEDHDQQQQQQEESKDLDPEPNEFVIQPPNPEAIEYDDVLCESRVYKQYTLFRQPVMVGSKYCHTHSHTHSGTCPYVNGGYFLINGNEKVVLPQEKLRNNYFYVTDDKSGKHIYKGEIRSWHESKIRTTSTLYAYLSCSRGGTLPNITFDVPFIKGSIPLPQMFRLIGVQNTWEMRRYILARHDYSQEHPYDHYIRSILKDEHSELSLDELKVHVAKKGSVEPTKEKRIRFVDNIFHNEFLPHMGLDRTEDTQRKKAMFLGYMVMKLLRIYNGEQGPDDRDDYANKRLDPVHMLFALLLRQLLRAFLKTFTSQIHKAAENERHIFVIDMMKNSKRITAGFKFALSSGNWGMSKGASTQTGVAQVLTRMTPISTICHMRRTNTPINRDGKLSQPRQLQLSAWGLSCVTGDTMVLMADGTTWCPIRDVNLQPVTTVNTTTLCDEPSPLSRFFSKMPDKLLKLTTISGRILKCTPDHPILVDREGSYKMVPAGELKLEDNIIVKHMVLSYNHNPSYKLIIPSDSIPEMYRDQLIIHGLVNKPLPENTVERLARIVGLCWTDGSIRRDPDYNQLIASFSVGETSDAIQLMNDLYELGFRSGVYNQDTRMVHKDESTTNYHTLKVQFGGMGAGLLVGLGLPVGKRATQEIPPIPDWIMNGTLNIKREFLGGFQGGDGCRLSYQKRESICRPRISATSWTFHPDFKASAVFTFTQIKQLFQEFGITSYPISTQKVSPDRQKVLLTFNQSKENLARFADTIPYRYCKDKERHSAPVIEYLKTYQFLCSIKKEQNQQSLKLLANKKRKCDIMRETKITSKELVKLIKNPEKVPHIHMNVKDFYHQVKTFTEKVKISLHSIEEIPPELVYDVTTMSENHSFIGNGFVINNCSHESPEGQACGLIKNMALTTYIRLGYPSTPILDILKYYFKFLLEASADDVRTGTWIFINGTLWGVVPAVDATSFVQRIRTWRRIQDIPFSTSITHHQHLREVHIVMDSGCCLRPVFVLENIHKFMDIYHLHKTNRYMLWDKMISNGVVEYLDKEEESTMRVAVQWSDLKIPRKSDEMAYTHIEIHPLVLLGISASFVPLSNHNQSPRITYGSKSFVIYCVIV